MAAEKTHYRKAFNSPYLSSADITERTTLTIKHVKLETDKTKKTKDLFNTAYFDQREIRPGEPLKPMILNATNSKKLKDITGSAFIDDWNDVTVTVYVDPGVRFGKETVEGLRITEARALPPPASAESVARVLEFDEAGAYSAEQSEWIAAHKDTMTEAQVKKLLTIARKAA